jgi:hypothetical protein
MGAGEQSLGKSELSFMRMKSLTKWSLGRTARIRVPTMAAWARINLKSVSRRTLKQLRQSLT